MSSKRRGQDEQITVPVKRRKSTPNVDAFSDVDRDESGLEESGTGGGHMRFGSEEPFQDPDDESGVVSEASEADETGLGFSDDEAPEAVQTNEAQASALAAASKSRRAVERDRQEGRKKRRDAEERLRSQPKKASKKTTITKDSSAGASDSDVEELLGVDDNPRESRDLPDLLPEELLTDDLFQRPPSPEPGIKNTVADPKATKKLIKFESKPKDRRAGPVNLSVLDRTNRHLAPKANKSSQDVRQRWLAGRRGKQSPDHGRGSFKQSFVRV